jgi:hypothetical protein
MAAEEAVGLRQVHPAEQVRIVRPVRHAVRAGSRDVPVDAADLVDGALRVAGGAEGGGREEGTGPLQPAPRVAPVVGVLRDRGHGRRMQRLQQQRAKTANEHRGVPVHPPDRTIIGEPARTRRGESGPVGTTLRTSDPGEKRFTQAPLQRAKARGDRLRHHAHLLRPPSRSSLISIFLPNGSG